MTREDLDFIGSMNMCDEISNDAYKKIVCHCEEQEHIFDKIKDEIVEEKEYAYADFERYNEDLGQDWEDDFRYGMERCIEIIDKYKAESEG